MKLLAAANNPPSLSSLYQTAKDALLAGGRILRAGYAGKRRVFFKTVTSPVTHIDLMSERAVIGLIRKRFPDHAFLAEESSYLNEITTKQRRTLASGLRLKGGPERGAGGASGYRWIIDPLDGTVNYLHGLPQSCVSIAVEKAGELLAGGVYDPFRDELFMARKGGGATMNGKKISVSQRAPLQRALLVTGFPYDHQRKARYYMAFMEPFLRKSMDIRRLGSAALDLSWVACGRLDGYWEFNLNPWDVAAGYLLVQEAGGIVSDFRGEGPDIERPRQTLASNGKIHAEMVKVFNATFARLAGPALRKRKKQK